MEETKKYGVTIYRESRASYSARTFYIWVDGEQVASINNGQKIRLMLEQGEHEISFAIGKNVQNSIKINLTSDANIVCYADWSTIAVRTTVVDLNSPSPSDPATTASNSSGCGAGIVGLILLLIGLAILGIRFVWRIDFTLVPM